MPKPRKSLVDGKIVPEIRRRGRSRDTAAGMRKEFEQVVVLTYAAKLRLLGDSREKAIEKTLQAMQCAASDGGRPITEDTIVDLYRSHIRDFLPIAAADLVVLGKLTVDAALERQALILAEMNRRSVARKQSKKRLR